MPRFSRRSAGLIATVAAAGTLLSRGALAQSASRKNKLVFQVSDADPGKWNLTLHNVWNAQSDLPDDSTDIEVVVYGPAIGMLKAGSPVAADVAKTLKKGVKVVACENTMKGLKLTYDDMLPAIGFVPAGVVEIMRKQQEGYAYIRP
ncbi:MAG: DsrE family protein [Gammaproteobacteria bacterium]|nr:DsrE family protein [Gammaproteobacteria bacterium]MBU1440791.1 DsrE family protein [Gammaproteobacteria bacterium]MBU2287778.1 DsrE family protein [Gammaproteobacteria bacterium]MBU2411109.1 DsrE family protein [Gammaproteobacteria bacterium]